jgi:D-glycero-D-manno-heptose 1,7-bisphosphate phosphatase
MNSTPAIFLDRDGVLIEDVDLLIDADRIHILAGVPAALQSLKRAGYRFIVISNQPVVARGLLSESDVLVLQEEVSRCLLAAGAPRLDAFYFCPHHPNADLSTYRLDCDCRKPKPGLLLRAAQEYGINLAHSFMIGDRITDIIAGARAGCRTILVQTGKHLSPIIHISDPLDTTIQPNFSCPDLPAAANWILEKG